MEALNDWHAWVMPSVLSVAICRSPRAKCSRASLLPRAAAACIVPCSASGFRRSGVASALASASPSPSSVGTGPIGGRVTGKAPATSRRTLA